MDSGGDASTLTKIAVFCIAFSIIAVLLTSVYAFGTSDYDYDTIKYNQNLLYEYTGGTLVNDNPWMLTSVYTPFDPIRDGSDMDNHRDPDGWVFGESITTYPYLDTSVHIKLDVNQKSNQTLSYGEYSWSYIESEKEWHKVGKIVGKTLGINYDSIRDVLSDLDIADLPSGYTYNTGVANNWNFTGYLYKFDPMLPFSTGASSKDGSLYMVWYETADDTGLSGGLQIYKNGRSASSDDKIIIAQYSAADIIAASQSSGGHASVYNFNFDGILLHLAIQFGPTVMTDYASLKAAWDSGDWDMAVSAPSAGNFFDVENSTSFVDSAGNMLDTFIQIYTFKYPKFQDDDAWWANIILWLIVGLPMTMGLLMVTARLVGGVFRIF